MPLDISKIVQDRAIVTMGVVYNLANGYF